MIAYQTKSHPIPGKNRYDEIIKPAREIIKSIEKKTKRQPYLRSAFFNKEKIFLNYSWPHLNQKPIHERPSRLKLLPCAVELIENSRQKPTEKINPNQKYEKIYRFLGKTPTNRQFCVQIKKDLKTDKKYFMSVFYYEKQKSPAK